MHNIANSHNDLAPDIGFRGANDADEMVQTYHRTHSFTGGAPTMRPREDARFAPIARILDFANG